MRNTTFLNTLSLLMMSIAVTSCTQTAGQQIESQANVILSETFTCSDGHDVHIISSPAESNLNLIEVRTNTQTLAMRRVSAASGNKFSGGGSTWWEKGDQATLTLGQDLVIECQKVSLNTNRIEKLQEAHENSSRI